QAGDMGPKRLLCYFKPIPQFSISREPVGAPRHKKPPFVEQLLLGLAFVICRKPFYSSREQGFPPPRVKKSIFAACIAVSLEKRFRFFRQIFMEGQKLMSAATFKRACTIGFVCQKIFHGGEQK